MFIFALEKSREAVEGERVLLLANALQGNSGEGVRSVSELLRFWASACCGATRVTCKRVSEATEQQAVARAESRVAQ